MFAIFQGIAFNEKVINYFDTLYEMYANNKDHMYYKTYLNFEDYFNKIIVSIKLNGTCHHQVLKLWSISLK